MDSYEIDECHSINYTAAASACQSLRQSLDGTTTRFLKRSLESDLARKTQEKTDEAVAGLNAQIELLQLLKGTPSFDTSPYIEALNKTFPEDDISELRHQYELDRDTFITPMSLPTTTRQTRSQARVAKRSLADTTREHVISALLDTPVVKKPRRNNAQKLAIPQTPAPLPPRRSSRLATVSKVNFAEAAFVDAEDSEYDIDGQEAEAADDGEADDLPGDDTFRLPGSVDEGRMVKTPFVDERGYTRIGPHLQQPQLDGRGNMLIYPTFLAAWAGQNSEKQRGGTKITCSSNYIAAY